MHIICLIWSRAFACQRNWFLLTMAGSRLAHKARHLFTCQTTAAAPLNRSLFSIRHIITVRFSIYKVYLTTTVRSCSFFHMNSLIFAQVIHCLWSSTTGLSPECENIVYHRKFALNFTMRFMMQNISLDSLCECFYVTLSRCSTRIKRAIRQYRQQNRQI